MSKLLKELESKTALREYLIHNPLKGAKVDDMCNITSELCRLDGEILHGSKTQDSIEREEFTRYNDIEFGDEIVKSIKSQESVQDQQSSDYVEPINMAKLDHTVKDAFLGWIQDTAKSIRCTK